MKHVLFRGGRVVIHSVVGGVLVAAGIVMLVTPGPGLLAIVVGLAVLAREYAWAHHLQGRLVGRIRDASTAARARLAARRAHHRTLGHLPTAQTAQTPEPEVREAG